MKFIDPLPTTCDRCSATSPLRVAELLSLRAFCTSCGCSLAGIGCKMRANIDEFGAFFAFVEIAVELDDKLSITICDAELEFANTLRQLAAIVQRKLPRCPEAEARSLEIITATAGRVSSCKSKEISLDKPIMDALAPSRWKDTAD